MRLPIVLAVGAFVLGLVTAVSAQAQGTQIVISSDENAVAYYFNASEKLVAVEYIGSLKRTVKKAAEFHAEDGLDLVMKSSCQQEPLLTGQQDMAGKASIVVYAASGTDHLRVLGVEDFSGVLRTITAAEKVGEGGICCCTLIKCGSFKCCPPGCPKNC